MQARYYVAINSNGERTIIDADNKTSLLNFLRQHSEGILFLGHEKEASQDEYRLQINFNVRTGEVALVNVSQPSGVTDIYESETLRNKFTQPLYEAIAILAKQRLLEHLFEMGDDHVTHVILIHHLRNEKGGLEINVLKVDHTLGQLRMRPLFSSGGKGSLQDQLDQLLQDENLRSLDGVDKIKEQLAPSSSTNFRFKK